VSTGEKILVVGPSWVGDMVMAQALYRSLWQRRSHPEIHVAAPAWSKPVLARMPEVTRAIELPVAHGELALGKRLWVGRRLRREHYSQAIVLPRSLKAALVPFFAAVPRRTGFRGEYRFGLINDMREFDATKLDQTVKRFVALGMEPVETVLPAIPNPCLELDPENLAATCERLGLRTLARSVALMPGAEYGTAKRWPLPYYAQLAGRLAASGIEVLVLGSPKERALGDSIDDFVRDPHVHNLCGQTSLADAVDLLGQAAVAVTNDSGLMHVAAAAGCHVVAIYGSSSPSFTPPLTARKDVLYRELECSPCFARECPLQHLRCLTSISVDEVWDFTKHVVEHHDMHAHGARDS
jgi:lipopolysaccharide heptosyltransferase II